MRRIRANKRCVEELVSPDLGSKNLYNTQHIAHLHASNTKTTTRKKVVFPGSFQCTRKKNTIRNITQNLSSLLFVFFSFFFSSYLLCLFLLLRLLTLSFIMQFIHAFVTSVCFCFFSLSVFLML